MSLALRLWVRQASRQRALTAFLMLSLAVSLGGGAFALSLNSAVLWRSLPFKNARDLVSLDARDSDGQRRWLSWAELEAVAASPSEVFESAAGYTAADFNALSEPGLPPEPLSATVVSSNFFKTFRISAAQGQLPSSAAYGASRDRVVLLTHDFWRRRYRGAPDIVGRSVRLSRPEYLGGGEAAYRVIGVLPRETWLFWKDFDIVVPMQAELSKIADSSRGLFERTVGRTSEDAAPEAVRSSMPILLERIRAAGSNRLIGALTASPLQDSLFADLRPQLTVVLWLAVAVFSLAGVNVVISTIAQAADQRRSTAVRLALGASYQRLLNDTLRQHSITLGLAAVAGLVLAQWLVVGVGSRMPSGWISRIPGGLSSLRMDWYVLAWLVTGLVGMSLVSGGAVHLATRRLKPWSLLGSSGAEDTVRSRTWRSTLVGIEIALCSAVVITSLTLLTQLTTLRGVTFGVDETRTSAVWVNLGSEALAEPAARVAYYDRILREADSLAGLEAIGGVSHPFNLGWDSVQLRNDSSATTPDITALARSATPHYLLASGIRLLAGRWFAESDRANAPMVAVVSESLARAKWPKQSAIGQQLVSVDPNGVPSPASVVGVVADTRHAPHLPPDRIVYRPVAQAPPPWLYLIVRARPGAQNAVKELNEAIWRVNPDQPIDGPWPVSESIEDRTVHLRFVTLISLVLGGIGLVLSAAGLYGLTSWSVTSSRRSIAVRRAVGASNEQISAWLISQWAKIVVPGLVGGWVLQSLWTSVLVAAIQGLQAPTVSTVLLGIGLMAAASALAAVAPLRRALAADASALMR